MNRNDLSRVMAALGLRIQGENSNSQYLNCSCPFASATHKNGSDNSASFGCRYDDRGISSFKCHACKQHGSISNLVRRLGDFRQRDYSALLTEVRNIEAGHIGPQTYEAFDKPDALPDETLQPLNEALWDGLFPPAWEIDDARNYLLSRGISEQTAVKLGLLYRDTYTVKRQDGSEGQWFRGDILFPVRDRDNLLYGYSGRTTRDAFGVKPKVFDRDLPKRHLILGEHRWREGLPKIIVEGLMGWAHLIEVGVEEFADVGAVMGSAWTPEKAARLKSWGDPCVGLFDNDQAGSIGLFGIVREDGTVDDSQSFVSQMIASTVVIVPEWPYRPDETQKDDPDQLTYGEVYRMVYETMPMVLPKPKSSRFPVDKHFNRR
ncbi:hypothetical protein J2J97_31930 (plasmid) [Rhizobium bangladeshense]|uniref:hypothetical protein n=1 Tax=Rhizobium bangladeshense TaxID=1138189 RepID=UPI001A99163E|nr:hypothetical protein [Rhizobium bangladeshense]QSY98682.1 hypothetical protein J2J97_31930 [Rhizobium bangladeshense]